MHSHEFGDSCPTEAAPPSLISVSSKPRPLSRPKARLRSVRRPRRNVAPGTHYSWRATSRAC